jgi:hypothetical protein
MKTELKKIKRGEEWKMEVVGNCTQETSEALKVYLHVTYLVKAGRVRQHKKKNQATSWGCTILGDGTF